VAAACESVQDFQDRIDRGQHMGLGAPEGGKPEPGQAQLQRPQIATPEAEIMDEVAGAFSKVGVNLIKALRRLRLFS
jgi:hypothetical protein